MKKMIAMFLAAALVLVVTGCSAANAPHNPGSGNVPAAPPADTPAQTVSAPAQTPPATTPAATAALLTREQVEQIALDYLGFTADQVTRLHSEFEIDDGIAQYDVQFIQGDWEYEFEISAEDGRILSYDKEHKYD